MLDLLVRRFVLWGIDSELHLNETSASVVELMPSRLNHRERRLLSQGATRLCYPVEPSLTTHVKQGRCMEPERKEGDAALLPDGEVITDVFRNVAGERSAFV